MAILPIVQFPNPVLAMKCQPVSEVNDTIRRLAADMGETMYKAPGVGLAAPQVGEPIRMVVIDVSEEKNNLLTLINPVITEYDDEKETGEEGCLSLPGIWEKVTRSTAITVQYTDLDGQPQEIHAEGLLAICIQHELDHLDGTVFIDHLSRLKYDRACAKLKKRRQQEKRDKND
ncbi:peptide deformylase [Parasutterella secunda]|uniref:peptide deformylase n=1 Tax=Parasutterella secunda TaxID=626947 RepID=UPI0025A3836C|nr:peptide deformylase [Parasutterella secunda]MDM8112296.1 peptide deformylase [Parasutterella secunda]MDM8217584.1 peptide deformylase [Parasutterella secunda]